MSEDGGGLVARLAGEVVAQHVRPTVCTAWRLAHDQQPADHQKRSSRGNDISRRTEAASDDSVDPFAQQLGELAGLGGDYRRSLSEVETPHEAL